MAHHKSAIKAHKQSLQHVARNRSIKSQIKGLIRKVEHSVGSIQIDTSSNNQDALQNLSLLFRRAESAIMKGVSSGVLKLNTAARRVSNLAKLVKRAQPVV